ncbi:MAG TPA: hypothetical protein VFZ64_06675 [Nocardioidaceae bacterium]
MDEQVKVMIRTPEWFSVALGVALVVIGGLALIESGGYDDLLQLVGLLFGACGFVGIIAGSVAIGVGMARGDRSS